MKKVTLHNYFHNTKVSILVDEAIAECSDREIYRHLESKVYGGLHPDKNDTRKLRKVQKALCGMSDCECGTVR